MAVKIITPPASEPITLAEAKAQCRISGDDEDTVIAGYIMGARRYCESIDWRAYLTQTRELWLDAWPREGAITIPKPPLQSISYIRCYDDDDVATTLASSDYYVDVVSEPGRVVLRSGASWPGTALRVANGVCVRFVAGWANPADVPQTIKQAILLIVGHWNENREAAISGTISRAIDFGVRALLDVERRMRF